MADTHASKTAIGYEGSAEEISVENTKEKMRTRTFHRYIVKCKNYNHCGAFVTRSSRMKNAVCWDCNQMWFVGWRKGKESRYAQTKPKPFMHVLD